MDSVWRLKGSHQLSRPALAVLRELWRWREAEAIAANKPPFFVMSHEALVGISEASCVNLKSIEPFLPKHLSERRRSGLTKAIEQGLRLPADHHPKPLRFTSRHPSEGERRRFIELQKLRDARAAELGIDATLIASRATLSDLAYDWDKHQLDLMNWQRDLLKPVSHPRT
jgi:ribonuclease D